MKYLLATPPLLAAVFVLGWSTHERRSTFMLEKASDALQTRLDARSVGTGMDATSSTQKSPSELTTEKGSLHFKKLTALMAELQRTGSKLSALHLEQYFRDLTPAELISTLAEIDSFNAPTAANRQLIAKLFKQLCQKAPESALARLAASSTRNRDEMIQAVTSAMGKWSKQDLAMAETWLGAQVTAGKFDSATYDGKNRSFERFESGLMAAWIESDPTTAAARLSALSNEQRASSLRMYAVTSLKEKDQLSYANLVRSLIPEKDQMAMLSSFAAQLAPDAAKKQVVGTAFNSTWNDLPSDFTIVTDFLNRIDATPAERRACVNEAVRAKLIPFVDCHVTSEKIDTVRAWASEQAPDLVDQLTSEMLWYQTMTGTKFTQVVEQANRYSDENGNDNFLCEFLSHKMDAKFKGEARLFAEKITNPERRQAILDGLK